MRQYYAFSVGQVSIGATASQIVPANPDRSGIIITNLGANTVYIGEANVTTTTGQAIQANSSIAFSTTLAIYGVAATGSNICTWLQTQ